MNKIQGKKQLLETVRKTEGWLSDHESLFLYSAAILSEAPGQIVEIGSWKGKSTVCLAKGLIRSGKSGYVWAIDPHEGKLKKSDWGNPSTYRDFLGNIKSAGVEYKVKPVVKTSLAAAASWNDPVKLLFIDGIHDYEHTGEDYSAWEKFAGDGAMIAFHDCFCGELGVWQAVNQYFISPDRLLDIGTVGSILFGIKGKAGNIRRLIVRFKISIIRTCNLINSSGLPGMVKMILVHKLMRLMLINKYSLSVYI